MPAGSVRASPEGARLLEMILDPRGWIARREDTVEFADGGGLWCVCRVSVWPYPVGLSLLPLPEVSWIPLEFINKGEAANADVREYDEEGRQVAQLLDQHGLGAQALATLARIILGRECSPATARAIGTIVASSAEAADVALRALIGRKDDAEAASLTHNRSFMLLAGAFAAGDLLLVDFARGRSGRGLTFSYRYGLSRSPHRGAGSRRLQGRATLLGVGPRVRGRVLRISEIFGCRSREYPISCRGSFPGREHVWTVRLPALGREAVEILTTHAIPPASEGRLPYDAKIAEGPLTLSLTGRSSPDDWRVRLVLAPRRGSDLLAGRVRLVVRGRRPGDRGDQTS